MVGAGFDGPDDGDEVGDGAPDQAAADAAAGDAGGGGGAVDHDEGAVGQDVPDAVGPVDGEDGALDGKDDDVPHDDERGVLDGGGESGPSDDGAAGASPGADAPHRRGPARCASASRASASSTTQRGRRPEGECGRSSWDMLIGSQIGRRCASPEVASRRAATPARRGRPRPGTTPQHASSAPLRPWRSSALPRRGR